MNAKRHKANRALSEAIFEQVARIGKAASNPKRLELLELLSQAPRTVEALSRATQMSQANTSQHLQALSACHLVKKTRDGTSIWYRLADEHVADFLRTLRTLAATHLAELDQIVNQYFNDHEGLEPADKKTLIKKIRQGEVTVLDVRPIEEYEAGHIPGALSIPIDELESRLCDVPEANQVVAYCRGPFCVWSEQATEILKAKGYNAVGLSDGVTDWRARGFRIASGLTP